MRLVPKEEPPAATPSDAAKDSAAELKKAKPNADLGWLKNTLALVVGGGGSYLGQDWAVSSAVADKKAAMETDPAKSKEEVYKEISGLLGIAAGVELALALGVGYVAFKHVEQGLGRFLLLGVAAGLGAGAIVNGIDAYNYVKMADEVKVETAAPGTYAGAANQR